MRESMGVKRLVWKMALWLCMMWGMSAVFAPSQAYAYDDLGVTYKTLVTPHFEIHYQSQLEAFAQKTAVLSEEAHAVFVPLLGWTPAGRTQVVVNDRLDTANGSATAYGRNTMNIYGMPPESDSVLGYYDDWLRILVYHEYVHVLHLDTALGISPYVNSVIGKILNPNQLIPRWYVEGYATYHESARTGTGRLNSSLYKMWLRAESLAPEPVTFGQTNNSLLRWPFGSVAYLFGGFFLKWVAERHGEDFFVKFHRSYGAKIIPFGINRVAREVSGEDFDQMWTLWSTEIQAESLATQVLVHARGMDTMLEQVTHLGGEHKFPRVRPGHDEVSVFRNTFHDHPRFATVSTSPEGAEIEKLFEADAASGASAWTPDGRKLLYSRKVITKNVYQYEDLFLWDANTGDDVKLTTLDRARDPAISPDGRQVVYVRNRFGTMELVRRELEGDAFTGEEDVILSGQRWEWDNPRHWQQIATPQFLPDGSGVVFGWWRADLRKRDLWLYRFPSTERPEGSLEALMRDDAMDLDPEFGPDGRLYFSSDRTGIYNIYAMDLETREVEQLTDVTMGVFTPRHSEDGQWLYMVSYSYRGYDLVRMALDGATRRSAAQSSRVATWRRYPEIDVSTFEQRRYQPLRNLKPLIFIPDVAVLLAGVGASATVTGYEPTARHLYTLTAGVLSDPQFQRIRPSIGGLYRFSGAPFSLTFNGAYREYPNSRSLFAESTFFPFIERQILGLASFTRPISSTFDDIQLTLSYSVDHRSYGFVPEIRHEPGDLEPRPAEIGWFNQLSLSASYNLLERYSYSVSNERGISLSGNMSVRHPSLGSDYKSLSLSYGAQGFLPLPWLEHHVLSASVVGGFIQSNFRDQAFFSLGGNSLQNVFQSAVFQGGSSTLVVRGYPVNVQQGRKYLVSSLEWRFPLLDLERGFSTAPLYFRRLKGRAFFDYGSAYEGYLADAQPLMSVGGELVLTALFGYYVGGNFRLGYARGLTGEDAIHDAYLLYGGGF